MAGVFNLQGEGERAALGGASTDAAFRGEVEAFRKIAAGDTPDVGRDAAAGAKKEVEFHAGRDFRQR